MCTDTHNTNTYPRKKKKNANNNNIFTTAVDKHASCLLTNVGLGYVKLSKNYQQFVRKTRIFYN